MNLSPKTFKSKEKEKKLSLVRIKAPIPKKIKYLFVTDIATYWLNWHKGRFREKYNPFKKVTYFWNFITFIWDWKSTFHTASIFSIGTTQFYGRTRQCRRLVGARCSRGLGRNPLINGLIQHTFKTFFSFFFEKFPVIPYD